MADKHTSVTHHVWSKLSVWKNLFYKRRKTDMSKRKGFTLIELLVVISIIVLLMAILLPSLQRVNRQAKAVACQANLRQWGLYFCMDTRDHDGKLLDWPVRTHHWPWVMRRYYRGSEDVLLCPMAMKHKTQDDPRGGNFSAWEYCYRKPYLNVSYGLNGWLRNTSLTGRSEIGTWNTCYVKGAGNIPVLLDSIDDESRPRTLDEPPEYDDPIIFWPMALQCSQMSKFCINRHDGGINNLFMDWSVRKVMLKELWTLKWHREFNTTGPWTKTGGVLPEDWPKWMRRFRDS